MLEIIKQFVRRMLMGKGKGILQIPPQSKVDAFARDLHEKFIKNGIPNEQRVKRWADNLYKDLKKAGVTDDMIKSEKDIKVLHSKFAEIEGQKIVKQFESMMKPKTSADVFDITGKKIDTSKPILGGKNVPETEAQIKTKLEGMNKKTVERIRRRRYEAAIKAEEAKAAADEDYIMKVLDPEDFAHGGRTGTGLNYLLGEDDQNSRVPFAMGKRAFLKWLGSSVAGIGAAKTGLFGLLKGGGGKKVVTEVAKDVAGSGQPPAYFFKLVEKIKTLGDDTLATQDKAIAKKYKDYTMQEDFAGNIEIMKKGDDVAEDVFMSYKVDDVPVKGKKKSTKVEEYEEYTARPDQEGKMKDIEMGVPDSVVMEVEAGSGNVPESFYTGINKIKKADGGRVPLGVGGIAGMLGE